MLTIKSSLKNYNVILVDQLNELTNRLTAMTNAVIVMDKNIAEAYPEFKAALLSKLPVLELEAIEEKKTLSGAETVLNFLQSHKANKSTTVVAIGGGIIQDVASFAAHIYYRGIPFVFVPTTLLAMSDSCIGAKCGLNYHGFKNQIGAFHSPDEVIICDIFLKTLSDEAIYSGYGEILKLMLTGGEEKYRDLIETISRQGFRNEKTKYYILESLKIKKYYIEEDEFDVSLRRILNYGHTFGHALELATDYMIPHGVAVVRGIDLANFIAYNKGLLSQETYNDIHQFIAHNFGCGFFPKVSAEELISYAKMDKKITNGKLNLILLQKPGFLKIETTVLDEHLQAIVQSYLESNYELYCTQQTEENL